MPLYFTLEKKDVDKILTVLELCIDEIVKIHFLITKFKKIDNTLYNLLLNDFINGKEFCEYYLEDLYEQKSESIVLRNSLK